MCHSIPPRERFTWHQRMSAHVSTPTKQLNSSNILALECSHISAPIEKYDFCSPNLITYQRWLEISHHTHVEQQAQPNPQLCPHNHSLDTNSVKHHQESVETSQSWCSNNYDGFWKGRVQQLRLHTILVTNQDFGWFGNVRTSLSKN